MTRILLIEDNVNLAFGLRANLEVEGYVVDVANSGEDGLERARSVAPELVILDLMLPGLDGFRVLRILRAEQFTMPVLVLTARGEESDKVRGLKLGADDYVTKPFGVLELLARVEALLRRARGSTPVTLGPIQIDLEARTVHRNGMPVELAPKEFELLAALVWRQGGAVSRDELLRLVWGYQETVVSRTVDTHVASLRRKLEADPATPSILLTVRRVGYRLALTKS
jgi:DNA-binding response OmpR family regulator